MKSSDKTSVVLGSIAFLGAILIATLAASFIIKTMSEYMSVEFVPTKVENDLTVAGLVLFITMGISGFAGMKIALLMKKR
jgi:hypothetical protein